MATKKRKPVTVFDDDGVLIEQTFPEEDVQVVAKKARTAPSTEFPEFKSVTVSDVFDTFAGYLNSRLSMNDSSSGKGTCVVCGKETLYPLRKICIDCLESNGVENIYTMTKEAIEMGTPTIELEVMENE